MPTQTGLVQNRKNGKNWHQPRAAFRPRSGQPSYEKRTMKQREMAAIKAQEQEMKLEKAGARERWIQGIKDRRTAKEEKERYERLQEKMHRKRVERLKRREKRNKLLKS